MNSMCAVCTWMHMHVGFGDGSELEVAMADMTQASAWAEKLAQLLAEANVEYTELVTRLDIARVWL